MGLLPYLERVASRVDLSSSEALEAMRTILCGEASQPQIAAFLVALRMKGETVEELVGLARAMRQMAAPIDCGPGGEASHPQCAGFRVGWRRKGGAVEELVGFARAMRQMAAPIDCGPGGEP